MQTKAVVWDDGGHALSWKQQHMIWSQSWLLCNGFRAIAWFSSKVCLLIGYCQCSTTRLILQTVARCDDRGNIWTLNMQNYQRASRVSNDVALRSMALVVFQLCWILKGNPKRTWWRVGRVLAEPHISALNRILRFTVAEFLQGRSCELRLPSSWCLALTFSISKCDLRMSW